jgi:hypothetical protein
MLNRVDARDWIDALTHTKSVWEQAFTGMGDAIMLDETLLIGQEHILSMRGQAASLPDPATRPLVRLFRACSIAVARRQFPGS